MNTMVTSDWLAEECDNMAREGLRTLVFASRVLSQSDYDTFALHYNEAKAAIQVRPHIFPLSVYSHDILTLLESCWSCTGCHHHVS